MIRNLFTSTALAAVLAFPAMASGTNGVPAVLDAFLAEMASRGLVADPEAVSAAAIEAIARTLDPGSQLLDDAGLASLRERETGHAPGFGLRLSLSNGVPIVREVASNSPGAAAGMLPGDTLLRFDGKPLVDRPLPDITGLLRGGSTQAVDFVIRRNDDSGAVTQRLSAARASLPLHSLETAERLPGDIGYVLLNGLYPDAGKDAVMRLREWSETGAIGVILDLRGAGGADVDAAMSIAALFCPAGSLVCTVRDRDDQDLAVHRCDETSPIDVPAILLIDEQTHGLAEALAGSLRDAADRVLLVGQPTAGDFGIREVVELPTGHHIRIATRKLVTVTGATFDGREGVTPDVAVDARRGAPPAYDPEPVAGRREVLSEEWEDRSLRQRTRGDRALQHAVDILLGLDALGLP